MASGLKSLVVCLGFTIFTSFFLLEDGPSMGRWIERHMGMKPSRSALVLGVPLLGTVALVTFLGAYVPIIGARAASLASRDCARRRSR
jgi:predicted PurR-regulated permease PerM